MAAAAAGVAAESADAGDGVVALEHPAPTVNVMVNVMAAVMARPTASRLVGLAVSVMVWTD